MDLKACQAIRVRREHGGILDIQVQKETREQMDCLGCWDRRVKWDPRVSLVCQGNVALQADQAREANRGLKETEVFQGQWVPLVHLDPGATQDLLGYLHQGCL